MAEPHRSLWLAEALGDAPDADPLLGPARCDVAIVGGGYVGLWTAIRIKQLDPACDVVLLEGDICGGGASGRNGGFALSWWTKLGTLTKLFGDEAGLALARASEDAVGELERFSSEHAIDAGFLRGGFLWTATTRAQLGTWDDSVALAERLGAGDAFVRLDADEVARRAGSPTHLAGVLEPCGATVQPARLARGLRRVALELGVRIHEHARVTEVDRRHPAVLRTAEGALTADRVVFATNAWAASLRELHTRLVVVSSEIVATAPIPDRLAQIGWTGGECISDSQLMVHYYRTTDDGRIAFGKGGWKIALAGRIGPGFDRDDARAADVALDFRRIYPALADVPIEQAWSGPIDRPRLGLPLIGRLGGREHLLYGVGWSGNGVAPSVIGGRVLASLALGRRDEWSTSPLVEGVGGGFPPEPLRYVGAHLVRRGVARKEAAEARGAEPQRLDRIVAGLAPATLVPKKREE